MGGGAQAATGDERSFFTPVPQEPPCAPRSRLCAWDGQKEEKAQRVLPLGLQELHLPQQNADLLLSSWLLDGQSWLGVLSASTDRRHGQPGGLPGRRRELGAPGRGMCWIRPG